MAFVNAQIAQQQSQRFGFHGPAIIGMKGQLVGLNLLVGRGGGDQLLGEFGAFTLGDHPTDHITAKNIDDRIRVNSNKISGNAQVPVIVNGKQVRMKPGQVWDEVDDTVTDSYAVKRTNVIEEIIEQVKDMAGEQSQEQAESK